MHSGTAPLFSAYKKRLLAGAVVLTIGFTLLGISLYDIYVDAIIQNDPLHITLAENSLPILFDLILLAVGFSIVSQRWELKKSMLVAKWTLAGVGLLASITLWVYFFQTLQSEVKIDVILAHTTTIGAVFGVVIGLYSYQQYARQTALEAERDRVGALFENSTDCIVELEQTGDELVIIGTNDRFTRTFGYDDTDTVGKTLSTIFSERDRQAFETRYVTADNTDNTAIIKRQDAQGNIRSFRVTAIPLTETGDRLYFVYTDLTLQYTYQERLSKLHGITRSIISAETTADVATKCVTAAESVLELKITTVMKQTDGELVPVAWTPKAESVFDTLPTLTQDSIAWDVYETKTAFSTEDVRTDDRRWNKDTKIKSEMIAPLGSYGVLMVGSTEKGAFSSLDFTLFRVLSSNIEASLSRADREEQLRAQEAALEERNNRLETFASVVSHDLRNPLSIAQGYLELARSGEPSAFDRTQDALARMETLIGDLLTLARHGEVVAVKQCRVTEVATSAWSTVETGAATLSIESEATIAADESLLRQLFENLFRNAIEHGECKETPLEVVVGSLPDESGFYVADSGPGIPSADRETVFEYGYTSTSNGTGFGLAIVNQIVQDHGWVIEITDADTGGARFEIRTD